MPVSEKTRQAQLHYFKQQIDMVDFQTLPTELRDTVDKTAVSSKTMGEVVRYAHERLAAAYREVHEAENALTQRGIFGKDRGYGRAAEASIEKCTHRDDADWIRRARVSELVREARAASYERRCVEASTSNLRQLIENHDDVEALKAAGRVRKSGVLSTTMIRADSVIPQVSVSSVSTESPNTDLRGSRDGGNRGSWRGRARGGQLGRNGGQRGFTDSSWWRDR